MKRIIASLVGQSNENGNGILPDRTSGYGCPLRDPVGPNGTTKRSMWPYLADLAGKRGTWLNIYNTAVGSTSITASWCGQIKTWTSGIIAAKGLWLLSSGGLWQCNLAAGTLTSSTIQPTGTSNTTGTDGVPWVYIGVPGGADLDGTVCTSTHARWDPNGYIAAALAGLTNSVGYDQKWMFLGIGQTDKTLTTGRTNYAQGIINVTDFFLSQSVKVALGFTVYSATSGCEAYYQSDLLPGYGDALTHYSDNSNVVAGANLRTALGVLTVTPASGPGLQSDSLHMNDLAYGLASEAWATALIVAGVI